MMHDAVQLYVFVTSMLSAWAVARTDGWNKWAYIAGLASEPAWLYIAVTTDSWGVVLLTIWWTWYWAVGAWRRFGRG